MSEILAGESPYDFSYRGITTDSLDSYRGLPRQITVNTDDKLRPILWYGDKVGHFEEVLLKSDFVEGTLKLDVNGIATALLTKTVEENSIVLDPNTFSNFDLALSQVTDIEILDPNISDDHVKQITIIFTNLRSNVYPNFPKDVKWINGTPVFNTYAGAKYLVRLIYTPTGWNGELASAGISNGTGSLVYSDIHAETEWILPAGSISGDEPDKITDAHFLDVSFDEKQAVSKVYQNISTIVSAVSNLSVFRNVMTNLETFKQLNADTSELKYLAQRASVLMVLKDSLNDLTEVRNNLGAINIVARHISDKDFVEIKATANHITSNTILKLNTLVLAPSEYPPVGEIDTDSSDGSITPLLVYSDHDVADHLVNDGTIIVSPATNIF